MNDLYDLEVGDVVVATGDPGYWIVKAIKGHVITIHRSATKFGKTVRGWSKTVYRAKLTRVTPDVAILLIDKEIEKLEKTKLKVMAHLEDAARKKRLLVMK